MRKAQLPMVAIAALALSLGACDATDETEKNIAAEDFNATMNLEEAPPVEQPANIEEAVAEDVKPDPAETKPTPAKPAPEKPASTGSGPKPAESKPGTTAAAKEPDPTCLPEHRAAGHC